MRRFSWPLAIALLTTIATAQSNSVLPKLNHFDPTHVDRTLDPCDDFYKFVCSKWEAANPIPSDQAAWSTGSNLYLWNQTILRDAMEGASHAKNRDAVQQKIGDYWAACMDEKSIEKNGLKPIEADLKRIAAMKSKSELPQLLVMVQQSFPAAWAGGNTQTNMAFFGYGSQTDLKDATLVVAGLDQGGMGLPGRDYYLSDNASMVATRKKYEAHVTNLFKLAGESTEQAAKDAATVLRIETAMAQAAMDAVARRDPTKVNNVMSLVEIQKLMPSFDWSKYFKLLNSPTPHHYLVTAPEFFRGLDHILAGESVSNLQTYLRWWTLHGHAPYLSEAFVDENFDFFGRTLSGSKELTPRWRRCVNLADRDLGYTLGQAYVEKAFPPSSKDRVLDLVKNIESGLDSEIGALDWMSPETKQQAKTKLVAIENKIGYPNHWRDYSSVKIVPNDLVSNIHQATAFEFKRQLDKIGKPIDRAEWTETPPTIDAYYDPQMNTINFPAGILQPPYFDPNIDDAPNYGAIGMVIGHEISHGFDDQGRKFDAKGNLRDWWTAEDGKKYDERAACISKEYTHDVPELGIKTNGELTLGEDSADNAGLRIAMVALEEDYKKKGKSIDDKDPDGWTPRQKFFISHAYSWCGSLRPELQRNIITTNPHSLNIYRVNYVERNFPEFWQSFGCRQGQTMRNENACRVW